MITNSLNWQVLREIAPFKKPYHLIRQYLAKWWADLFFPIFIGISGSVGKTTTKEAVTAVLSQEFETLSTKDNLDPVFNIPQTLLKIRPSTQMVVLELGIEYPNEMNYYLSLIQPDIGILTSLNFTHTEFLTNLDGVIAEKSKLVSNLPKEGWAILNYDDQNVVKLAAKTKAQVQLIGSNSKKCNIYYQNFRQDLKGSKFKLVIGKQSIDISWKLIGRHNVLSALAAVAVGLIYDLPLSKIKKGLETLTPQPHRLNVVSSKKGYVILDDSYNASPIAVKAAIDTLLDLAPNKRKIAVFGEMKELGEYAKKGHQEVAKKILDANLNQIYLAGGETKIIDTYLKKEKFKSRIYFSADLKKLAHDLKRSLSKNDLVLIKGSRHTHLERIVDFLQGKDPQINCNHCGKLSL